MQNTIINCNLLVLFDGFIYCISFPLLLLVLHFLRSLAMRLLLDKLHILLCMLRHSFWLLRNRTHLIKRYLRLSFRLLILDIWSFYLFNVLHHSTVPAYSLLFLFVNLLFKRLDRALYFEIRLWRLLYKVYLIDRLLAESINPWSPRDGWHYLNVVHFHWFHLDYLVIHLI